MWRCTPRVTITVVARRRCFEGLRLSPLYRLARRSDGMIFLVGRREPGAAPIRLGQYRVALGATSGKYLTVLIISAIPVLRFHPYSGIILTSLSKLFLRYLLGAAVSRVFVLNGSRGHGVNGCNIECVSACVHVYAVVYFTALH